MSDAGIPHFSEVQLLLHFYERPTLVPVSLTESNPKRIFTFMKKGKKRK